MRLAWKPLEGKDGHSAGLSLLAELYRQETGKPLPPIRKTPRGKPYFQDSSLHFSISHTQNHAFCCLSTQNIGIDAEECSRRIDLRLAERILSPAEKVHFAAAADPRDCLLRLWVLKESWAKLTGRGWGNYLRETAFDPNDPRIQIIGGCYVAVLEE